MTAEPAAVFKDLARYVGGLHMSHEANTSIRGTNHLESSMLELKKATAMMPQPNDSVRIEAYLQEVEAKALTAQAFNAIGESDLDTILMKIGNIRK